MDVTFIVGTFGDASWIELAAARAVPSCEATGFPVIHHHGETLAAARNAGASRAESEWLVFVDADDAVAPGYVEGLGSVGDLRVPRLILGGREVRLRSRWIELTNPCPIGTAIRRDMFADCGGFPEFDACEDWALFLRASRRGASIVHTDAVYVAEANELGRNSTVADPERLHREIRAWA